MKKIISVMSAVMLLLTGCSGSESSSKSTKKSIKNRDSSSVSDSNDADSFSDGGSSHSAYQDSVEWLTDGYYIWQRNDMEYRGTSYGETYGQMKFGIAENFKFDTSYFYPDGEQVKLLGGTVSSASPVEFYGNDYQIAENGDIQFEAAGGTNPGGTSINPSNAIGVFEPYMTWYYNGKGEYRTETGEQIIKQDKPFTAQSGEDNEDNVTADIDSEPGFADPESVVKAYTECFRDHDINRFRKLFHEKERNLFDQIASVIPAKENDNFDHIINIIDANMSRAASEMSGFATVVSSDYSINPYMLPDEEIAMNSEDIRKEFNNLESMIREKYDAPDFSIGYIPDEILVVEDFWITDGSDTSKKVLCPTDDDDDPDDDTTLTICRIDGRYYLSMFI